MNVQQEFTETQRVQWMFARIGNAIDGCPDAVRYLVIAVAQNIKVRLQGFTKEGQPDFLVDIPTISAEQKRRIRNLLAKISPDIGEVTKALQPLTHTDVAPVLGRTIDKALLPETSEVRQQLVDFMASIEHKLVRKLLLGIVDYFGDDLVCEVLGKNIPFIPNELPPQLVQRLQPLLEKLQVADVENLLTKSFPVLLVVSLTKYIKEAREKKLQRDSKSIPKIEYHFSVHEPPASGTHIREHAHTSKNGHNGHPSNGHSGRQSFAEMVQQVLSEPHESVDHPPENRRNTDIRAALKVKEFWPISEAWPMMKAAGVSKIEHHRSIHPHAVYENTTPLSVCPAALRNKQIAKHLLTELLEHGNAENVVSYLRAEGYLKD